MTSLGRTTRLTGILAVTALVLAACGDDDDARPGDATSAAPVASAGGVGSDEAVVLTHWDPATSGGVGDVTDALIAEFEAANPNITIERTARQFADYIPAVRLAVSGDDAPDVFSGNIGESLDGPLVKAGALMPLDDLAAETGWLDQLNEVTVAPLRYSEDGEVWGEGNLYGMSLYIEFVGVFYNREKVAALGIETPPATFADFEAALTTAQEAGETPIWFGNLDQWPAAHVYPQIQNQLSSAADISAWLTGADGSSFDTEGNLEAATILQRWSEAGYFNEGYNGLGYDDAWTQFSEGDGVFFMSGTWLNGQLQEAMADNVGFFLMPGLDAEQARVSTGGLADPWHISAQTDHPDEAKRWVTFLTGERAAELLVENSSLPAIVPAGADFPDGSLGALSVEAWSDLQSSDDGGVVPFLDMPTPSMGDTMFAALQELMDGRIAPEDLAATVQQDWDDFYGG